MKKLVCLFAVIALAAPLYAAEGDPNVVITCTDEGGGVCKVSYAVQVDTHTGDPGLVRGFALDISVSGNATITGVSGYDQTGTATTAPDNYGVFVGQIDFGTDPNNVDDWGTPVATTNTPYGPLPDNGMVVELASLYEMGVDTPPASSGDLLSFSMDSGGDADTTVTITANALRGEIVMEDVQHANIIATGCTVTFEGPCFPTTTSGGQQAYDDWVAFGSPPCWCAPPDGSGRQCYGDADGLTQPFSGTIWVGTNDIAVIAAAWQVKEPPKGPGIGGGQTDGLGNLLICADIDHKSQAFSGTIRVGTADIAIVAANWQVKEPPKGPGIPSDCPN
jgi:hypothetical protein